MVKIYVHHPAPLNLQTKCYTILKIVNETCAWFFYVVLTGCKNSKHTLVSNFIFTAIITWIACSLKFIINIIIIFLQARSNYDCGDVNGGRSCATWAKGLTMTSIGIGVALYIIIIILYATILRTEEDFLNKTYTDGYW